MKRGSTKNTTGRRTQKSRWIGRWGSRGSDKKQHPIRRKRGSGAMAERGNETSDDSEKETSDSTGNPTEFLRIGDLSSPQTLDCHTAPRTAAHRNLFFPLHTTRQTIEQEPAAMPSFIWLTIDRSPRQVKQHVALSLAGTTVPRRLLGIFWQAINRNSLAVIRRTRGMALQSGNRKARAPSRELKYSGMRPSG